MLDKPSVDHYYLVEYLDNNNVKSIKNSLTTNLIPSDNEQEMLRDLSNLIGFRVIGYQYKGSNKGWD